jgi:hypothetical protein
MTGSRRHGVPLVAAFVLLVALAAAAPATAQLQGRVFIGGFAAPYFYPFPFFPAYYPYPYWGYGYGAYGIPPPGWAAGRWEWRSDSEGRHVRVWVPSHLQ